MKWSSFSTRVLLKFLFKLSFNDLANADHSPIRISTASCSKSSSKFSFRNSSQVKYISFQGSTFSRPFTISSMKSSIALKLLPVLALISAKFILCFYAKAFPIYLASKLPLLAPYSPCPICLPGGVPWSPPQLILGSQLFSFMRVPRKMPYRCRHRQRSIHVLP